MQLNSVKLKTITGATAADLDAAFKAFVAALGTGPQLLAVQPFTQGAAYGVSITYTG